MENEPAKADPVLDAAAATFARLGYRRTSMDAVAHAAGCSRQLLYLRYDSKDRLFQATVSHALASQLADASVALKARGSQAARLAGALVAWLGAHAIASAQDAGELTQVTRQLAAAVAMELEDEFIALLAAAIGSENPARARAQARLLLYASHEAKRRSASLQQMQSQVRASVRALLPTTQTHHE
ncbi:AcrR family transcriptional regulator [Variovorax boronicumulans]|uniref:TetR/AcrR family transcriptional regulator n=1 Tax=Variovorax boronicumulans TaxID=436515 RepID=UPI00278150B7|nr:TetR/AcrR family transcriptional regulator [Variovorax boronicumulans]MDQ0083862.1 AcrR family transcriptional regulator [Variovorax boronicumulans]